MPQVSLAFDGSSLVGFATITDGVLAADISFLEVLPPHQGQGIGTALVRFYERFGFLKLDRGMGLRRRDRIRSPGRLSLDRAA